MGCRLVICGAPHECRVVCIRWFGVWCCVKWLFVVPYSDLALVRVTEDVPHVPYVYCSCDLLLHHLGVFFIALLHCAVVLHICCVLCSCSCNLSLIFSCAKNYFWCVVQGVLRINYLLFPVQRKLWVGSSDSCCTMLVSALSVLNTLHFTVVCCIGTIACFA